MQRFLLFAAVVASALIPIRATAQQEGGGPDAAAPFVDTLNVEIVNIDVWVTDKQGQPVTGLTRDDFVVRRDHEPVEIANFYAVEGGRAQGSEGLEPLAVPEDPARPEETALAPEHRLWLIVYVDNFNLHPLERKRIFPDLRYFLGSFLREGDRAMVVSYDRSLKVRQPFTEDASELYAALDEIDGETGFAVVHTRERSDILKAISEARDEIEALGYARRYAESRMNDVVMTSRALRQMIDSLAGLPGRKALLYVTSGVPLLAGEEMFQAVASRYDAAQAYAEIPRHDTTREFERVGHEATANRVAFYTIDAGGLRAMTFGTAEYGSFMTPGLRSTLESSVIENQQSSLRLLAQETGGQAILNRNELLPALREAAADFRTFYSLGISNPTSGGGKYHSIDVEVKRKGVVVRHRQGYRDKGVEDRMIESVRSALLYQHQENPLGISAKWGRPERASDGKNYILPIQLAIPLAHVVLLPTEKDRYELRLRLFVGVVDERGDVSEIDGIPIGLRIAGEHLAAAKGESFLYTHRLLIEKGRQKVGLGILDYFGNASSIISSFVTVGEEEHTAGRPR